MASVAVRHLRLTTAPGHAAASRQHIEDALRLSAPDEPRLLMLRRLDLGRLPRAARADAWTWRAGELLARQRARAVHASDPSAASADAVWFRSIDEARTLLLLLLASGRSAEAWFWRLVMPDGCAATLGACLARWVHDAECDEAAAIALARAVAAAAQTGLLPAITAALPMAALPVVDAPDRAVGVAQPVEVPQIDTAQLVMLLARLDAGVGHAVGSVMAGLPQGAAAALWIARMVVLAAAPELLRDQARCAALASVLVAAQGRPGLMPARFHTPKQTPMSMVPAARALTQPAPAVGSADSAPPMAVANADAAARRRHAHSLPAIAVPDAATEQASRAAGVLLVIRALDRLGLGARLAADGDAALAGFGRGLLCHIASRARISADDPLFAILAQPMPEPFAAALHAWRRGLAGWLRRRARVRLADLAGRRGWLLRADTELHVRLPLSAADLRLRRLALDVDPGWVPWLGLTVRYHFIDSPLR